jgi:preprotein translocase subunit SecE
MATTGTGKVGPAARIRRPFQNFARFLREVWGELQRVVWPSHEETYSYTAVVVIAVAIVAVWVGALDFIFASIVTGLDLYK